VKPLYADDFWDASVNWTRPMAYDTLLSNGSKHDADANFYMILGRLSDGPAKIIYIGMTFQQSVSTRLNQPDHQMGSKGRSASLRARKPWR
jgi:hypothetical protein